MSFDSSETSQVAFGLYILVYVHQVLTAGSWFNVETVE